MRLNDAKRNVNTPRVLLCLYFFLFLLVNQHAHEHIIIMNYRSSRSYFINTCVYARVDEQQAKRVAASFFIPLSFGKK
jgi:hypothetical protein